MDVILTKKPKGVTIIEGFPGFGYVGAIATEFLTEHLKVEKIGRIDSNKLQPMALIHKEKVRHPLEIYYSKKHNLVILQGLTAVPGSEWELAAAVIRLSNDLSAKEVISIEGVGTVGKPDKQNSTFYYTTHKAKVKNFNKIGSKPLKEGVIAGVSGALMLTESKIPSSYIFAATQSKLPDSRAAAEIIKVLDKYLGLKVDYKPLFKRAVEMEDKLKELLQQGMRAAQVIGKKNKETSKLSYFG